MLVLGATQMFNEILVDEISPRLPHGNFLGSPPSLVGVT